MRPDNSQFPRYQWQDSKEIIKQFKGDDYKRNRTFVIAVRDSTILKRNFGCKLEPLPGYDAYSAVIVERPGGHKELFIDPGRRDYRDMQLAFFEHLGIYVPANIGRLYQSDHAFPKSAVHANAGLVRAQLIPQPANSTFGSRLEKFRKGRKGTIESEGFVMGTLADVAKAEGLPLYSSDFVENLSVAVEMLIGCGLVPAKDRPALTRCVDEAMIDLIGDSTPGASMYDSG